jgi:hypothetical protein
MEAKRNIYRILMGEPQGKRPLERPRRRWENNIKTKFKETRFEIVDWIHDPGQGPVTVSCEDGN